jgi:aspartate aminotransferase
MPTPSLSRRVRALKPSATLAIGDKARTLKKQGVHVLNFALGEPDFDSPESAKAAAVESIRANQTHYMPTLGDRDTRATIADKLMRENGIGGLTPDHIAISVGAKHTLYLLCQCLLDTPTADRAGGAAADEVLLPVPSWLSYAPIAELAGGRIVELPTRPENDFCITASQLRAAITPRSRLLILNTPSNPCGTMYRPELLRELAEVVADRAAKVAPDLVIIVDEIYEKIVYGGIPHLSIGSLPSVAERTITVNGLSKAFAMTGWRVGYAACPGEFGRSLISAMDTLQGQMTSCITSFVYPAIRAALAKAGPDTERMRERFAQRAELAFKLAGRIPGVKTSRPTGAFYLFPDVSAHYGKRTPRGQVIGGSVDFASALLTEAHIASVPGGEFGGCGDRHIRLSFACAESDIEVGMERLGSFIAALRPVEVREAALNGRESS